MSRFIFTRNICSGRDSLDMLTPPRAKRAFSVMGGGLTRRPWFPDRTQGCFYSPGLQVLSFLPAVLRPGPDDNCARRSLYSRLAYNARQEPSDVPPEPWY